MMSTRWQEDKFIQIKGPYKNEPIYVKNILFNIFYEKSFVREEGNIELINTTLSQFIG